MKTLFLLTLVLLVGLGARAETEEKSVTVHGLTADKIVDLGLDPSTRGTTGNSQFISGALVVNCFRSIPLDGPPSRYTCVLSMPRSKK